MKAAVIAMPFCVLLWFHPKDEDLYNGIFIWEDLAMYPVFQRHYFYTSESGSAALYGSANGA